MAAISPGSSPLRRSALSEVAPQSSSTGAAPPRGRRWMQAWYRPPLPKASPEPANVTVTDAASGELTGTFWRVADSPAWTPEFGSGAGSPGPLQRLRDPPPAERGEPVGVIDRAEDLPQPDSVLEHPRSRIRLVINVVRVVLAHVPGEVVFSRGDARATPGE